LFETGFYLLTGKLTSKQKWNCQNHHARVSEDQILCFTCTKLFSRYEGLDRFIRLRFLLQPKSPRFVATKVAADGIIFGPFDLFVFFTYMGFSTGKNVAQVKEDVKRDFLPALILEGGVWPIFQVVNFRYVPVRYQLLYVNVFCLIDSAFLSWIEQQKDAPWKQWFTSFQPLKERGGEVWLYCLT